MAPGHLTNFMGSSGSLFQNVRRCAACVLLIHLMQADAQAGCTTLPCSLSFALYSGAPLLESSSTTAVHQSSIAPLSNPAPIQPSTTPSKSVAPSSTVSPSSNHVEETSIASPVSQSSPVKSVASSAVALSSSSVQSSLITTRLPSPTFSSSTVLLPSITGGPQVNSSSLHGSTSSQCGQCSVIADQVQVMYWPTASVRSDCARASSVSASGSFAKPVSSATVNGNRTLTALASAGSTDVINGFTYTFPSTYVSIVGRISVSDSCGVLGKTYNNPTPVAVHAITTASYANWPSTCRPQGNYIDAVINTLDIKDVACPTWGLSDPFTTTCDGQVYLTATQGPPYNPVILVPTEFLGYDPAWGACTRVQTNGPFILPCGVYDPPRALHTESNMMAPTPPASPPSDPPPVSAEPALAPASPNQAQPTAPPPQQPQSVQIPAPPVQTPGGSSPGATSQNPSSAAQPGQGSGNQDPANPADPGSSKSGSSNSGPSNPGPSNPGSGNSSPSNQGSVSQDPSVPGSNGQGSSKQDPSKQNQGAANPAPGNPGSSSGQVTGSQNAAAPNLQNAAPQPQAVPQTTINLGGQATPAVGGAINSPFVGNPPSASAGAGGSQGGGQGGGSTSSPGSSPEGASGGAPSSSGGTGSGPPAGSSGGSPGVPGSSSGGSSSGSTGGSSGNGSGAGSGGNPGGQSGSNQAGNTPAFTPHAITALGATLSVLSPTAVGVGGQILSAGGPAFTSNGNFFSVGPSGNLIAGALTPGSTAAPSLTFGGQTISANSAGQFIIAGQTLSPGGVITVSGTPVSEAPGGTFAVVGGSTQPLTTAAPTQGLALLTVAGSTYTANAASQFVIGSQTLTPGGQITAFGTVLSEAPTGNNFVVVGGSSTQTLAHGASPTVTNAAVMTFNGQTLTADAAGAFTINGQTLTPGGMITVSGTPISEAAGATNVVIGSSTEALSTAAVTQSPMAFIGKGMSLQVPAWKIMMIWVNIVALAGYWLVR